MQSNLISLAFNKIGGIFNHFLIKEPNPINRARIRMLSYILVCYLLFTGVLTISYFIAGEKLHLIRVSIVFVITISLIAITYFTHAWKIASHVILIVCTLGVYTNISIYVQNVNLETIQFVWLGILLSFYMHGLKWGWFYSIINILPVMIYTAIDNKNYFYIGTGPHEVSQLTYIFATYYNFVFITFLQYYFFKTFNKNFVSLTNTKNALNEINEKLKTSLHDVENLSNARMEFLSTMSHELRTPLNGVIGISNALLLQNPREDQEENLAVLKFSAENLLLLVNNILDFNKFSSDKARLENFAFDISALIQSNFSSIKLKAEEKLLHLSLHIDEILKNKYVISDPTRLTQVLSNLLNNAVKFTGKGSISLTVKVQQIDANMMDVMFIVEDTGIGVETERQENIFEAYVQATPSINRNYGGTGLGLTIVKKVLNMFGSKISLLSKPNVGTRISFNINFNYQQVSTQNFKETDNGKTELSHLKILVAEDNLVNILVIKKTLERWNVVPDVAENGRIALTKVEENNYDVILMDLYMPEMDGYEATVCIRNLDDKVKASTPIIAITADVNDAVIEKNLLAGINDVLPKPFDPEQLFAKIKQLTGVSAVVESEIKC
ncbi:response regulator [Pedobacter changchengzhani]|uniref:histidine kinase n=1 Tax=Pedobacter changchengzhani TaxID=2529274 RepID=A0A4R5MMK7_9SPHI|nr:ATP-binding protein [Pedobacter changchengzhani]TDG36912.1 response regulator [Pedobacter changchengzhani]